MGDESINENTIQITRHDEKISQLSSFKDDHSARLSELEKFKHRSDQHIHTAILVASFVALSGLGGYGLSILAMQKSNAAITKADSVIEDLETTLRQTTTALGEIENKVEETNDSLLGFEGVANSVSFKTGMIVAWYSLKPPTGWLLCDGVKKHNADEYSELYRIISKNNPDPRNTDTYFYTPNFSNRFLRGASDGNPAGDIVDAQVGSHSHPMFGSRANTNGKPGPALLANKHKDQHAAYMGGTENDGWYEIRSSPGDNTKRGHTYDNENKVEGHWPDHVTVYFIIKADTQKSDKQSTTSN